MFLFQNVENSMLWTKQENEILVGKLKQSLAEKDRTIEVNNSV